MLDSARMELARRQATYEDLFDLPEHVTGQIIDGELYTSPRPAGDHTVVASSLGMDLGNPFMRGRGGPGGWWIVDEPELHLRRDILVPDLAGWRRERLPQYPSGPFVTLAPDWVCEVLSPSTARLDRDQKRAVYAREGVQHLWLVDPQGCTIEIFGLRDGAWVHLGTHGGDDHARMPPFEAVELALGALWLVSPPATP